MEEEVLEYKQQLYILVEKLLEQGKQNHTMDQLGVKVET